MFWPVTNWSTQRLSLTQLGDLRLGQTSLYSGFGRSVCSAIGELAELVGVACWMSSHGCGPTKGRLFSYQNQ